MSMCSVSPSGSIAPAIAAGPLRPEKLIFVVLMVGILLRVLLASVNTQSNDSHLPVIAIIADENRFPEKGEAWEAFQPKLYHVTVAMLWRIAPAATEPGRRRIAQFVSCAAGIGTLLIVIGFLRDAALSERTRLLAFGMVALSPELIGIGAQATNDTFVILFGTLTLLFAHRSMKEGGTATYLALLLCACLAGLSKGNGLVVITAVVGAYVITVFRPAAPVQRVRRRRILQLTLFLVIVIPVVWQVGPYGVHQRVYGSPFVTNWNSSPRPFLFKQTRVERPGLTSVAHGLFTFRFIDLLRHPISGDQRKSYPTHRTSLWSRLYGQAHFVHFEQWPPSWRSRDPAVLNLGRFLFLFAVLPTALLLWKIVANGFALARRCYGRQANPSFEMARAVLVLAVFGHLLFVALYSIRLRDFSSMKFIFVLPGLLGFVTLLAEGIEDFFTACERYPPLRNGANLIFAALFAGYIVDVGILIHQLG